MISTVPFVIVLVIFKASFSLWDAYAVGKKQPKKPAPDSRNRLKKVKAVWIAPNGLRRSGSVLLSHSLVCSTIAAERLNFRVRNGNGWIPLAIATEKVVGLGYLRGYR